MTWRRRRKEDAIHRIEAFMRMYPDDKWSGYDLMRATSMRSGRVYPALDKLLEAGAITDGWHELEPGHKYRRRWYQARSPA